MMLILEVRHKVHMIHTGLMLLFLCFSVCFPRSLSADASAVHSAPALRLLKSGSIVYIRSSFSENRDLVVKVGLGTNRQVNFQYANLVSTATPMAPALLDGGTRVHSCGDDSTPWNINGTYIGANHGCSDARAATVLNHGLGVSDIGSVWHDAADTPFVILRIPDANSFWILSRNVGKGDVWKFVRKLEGDVLTHRPTGRTLEVSDFNMVQLRPSCRIAEQVYLLDGQAPIQEDVEVRGSRFEIRERYDIVCPDAVVAMAEANPGRELNFVSAELPAVIENTITYRFTGDGCCLIDYHAKALKSFNMGYMGFIQSARLTQGAYDSLDAYVPKTIPFTLGDTPYSFSRIQNYESRPPKPILFSVANRNVADGANLPDRFIQLLGREGTAGKEYDFGYALGYSLTRGMTVPGERMKNCGDACMLYKTAKTYPHAVDRQGGAAVDAGTDFHCVAYRCYFNPRHHAESTCMYSYFDGEATIVHADYHHGVALDRIKMPMLVGKEFHVVEKSTTVTIPGTPGSVPAEGIPVSVTGDYGFVVLSIP